MFPFQPTNLRIVFAAQYAIPKRIMKSMKVMARAILRCFQTQPTWKTPLVAIMAVDMAPNPPMIAVKLAVREAVGLKF